MSGHEENIGYLVSWEGWQHETRNRPTNLKITILKWLVRKCFELKVKSNDISSHHSFPFIATDIFNI